MSIVILVGGTSSEGNFEHRYLVQQFLDAFPDDITAIVTTEPVRRSIPEKIRRNLKRRNFAEKFQRILYNKRNPKDPQQLGKLLFDKEMPSLMPGGALKKVVSGHNTSECEELIRELAPDVIVVYGTALIKDNIFSLPKKCTLNMHTGLSPYYRGDSTLFWPVYYNDREHLGVTVHELVPEVDGGDIVYTGKVTYERGDSESHIFAKGVKTGTALYIQAVRDALADSIEYHKQDLSLGREFRWIHRTVEAEHKVNSTLELWAEEAAAAKSTEQSARHDPAEAPRRKAG